MIYCEHCGLVPDTTAGPAHKPERPRDYTAWICPRCGAVWAWWVEGCRFCNYAAQPVTTGSSIGLRT